MGDVLYPCNHDKLINYCNGSCLPTYEFKRNTRADTATPYVKQVNDTLRFTPEIVTEKRRARDLKKKSM